LELQAWQNGRTLMEQFELIEFNRSKVDFILEMIMNFNYVPVPAGAVDPAADRDGTEFGMRNCSNSSTASIITMLNKGHESDDSSVSSYSNASDCCANPIHARDCAHCSSSPPPSSSSSIRWTNNNAASEMMIAGGSSGGFVVSRSESMEDPCPGCLSLYCRSCAVNSNLALERVKSLLDYLDWVEHLYPSGRSLADSHPIYNYPIFVTKLKLLCMWFNVTTELWVKLQLLKRTLFIDRKSSPTMAHWPDLNFVVPSSAPASNVLTTTETSIISSDGGGGVETRIPRVRFHVMDESSTYDTYDSYSVRRSSSAADFLLPNAITNSDSSSSITNNNNNNEKNSFGRSSSAAAGEPSPYRTYVEKLLKTHGLKKTVMQIEKIFDGAIGKAYEALPNDTYYGDQQSNHHHNNNHQHQHSNNNNEEKSMVI
jgi:hypothetical protein